MGQQYSHLSSEERILIEKLHCEQHLSIRRTAERIGRDKSTVSRELRRGLWFASNENGSYRPYRPKRLKTGPWTSGPFYSALAAQRKADLRRRGSRKPHRMDSGPLRAWVLDALRRGWSPELIEGRLKAQCAGDPSMRISHECLYQWIYAKPQRALDLRQQEDAEENQVVHHHGEFSVVVPYLIIVPRLCRLFGGHGFLHGNPLFFFCHNRLLLSIRSEPKDSASQGQKQIYLRRRGRSPFPEKISKFRLRLWISILNH